MKRRARKTFLTAPPRRRRDLKAYDPAHPLTDKGPACFDVKHNMRFSLIYHFPNVKSNGFLSKLANGWWTGNIVRSSPDTHSLPSKTITAQTPMCCKDNLNGSTITSSPLPPGAKDPNGNVNNTPYTFIPFNKNTVITGNPNEWFNPLMFDLQPTYYQGTTVPGVVRSQPSQAVRR